MTQQEHEATTSALAAPASTQRGELSVEDVLGQMAKIQQVMKAVMKPDIHYGVVPGTSGKPSLYKPGAEKLCLVFRLDPEYEFVTRVEEPAEVAYTVRCTLTHITSGARVASGMGSCSSRETKYGFRKGTRRCPKCKAEAIIKGREEYGGGWLCYGKKGGCGAKYDEKDAAITSQSEQLVPVLNVHDQANTILKMACKRAMVAAVLAGTAASDFFTQDLEDLEEQADEARAADEAKNPPPPEQPKPQGTAKDRLRDAAPPTQTTKPASAPRASEEDKVRLDLYLRIDRLRKDAPAIFAEAIEATKREDIVGFDPKKVGTDKLAQILDRANTIKEAQAGDGEPAEREPGQDDEPPPEVRTTARTARR